MTSPSQDDRLVTFLRSHRPLPPPAKVDVENQIMAAIQSESTIASQAKSARLGRRQWAIPALAASLLLGWGSWATLRSPTLPTSTSSDLDTFITDTWYSATYGDDTVRLALDTTQPDWLFLVYATPY